MSRVWVLVRNPGRKKAHVEGVFWALKIAMHAAPHSLSWKPRPGEDAFDGEPRDDIKGDDWDRYSLRKYEVQD